MAAQIGNLQVRIGADIGDLQSRMRTARTEVAQAASVMNASLGRLGKGFGAVSKSAEDSAGAFMDGRRAAQQLIAAVDPLYAAQIRFEQGITKANAALKTGALDAQEYARVQAGLKAELDSASRSFGNMGSASGRSRAGLQQLGFQLGDVSQGIAMGTKASTIFAQQSGQVIQSLQLMGGEGNKFLRFLGGPWGLALSAGAVLLTPLIAKLFETKNEVGDLVDKMREQARQAALNEEADKAWKNTIEGLTEAIRKRREEQEKSLQTDIQAEAQSLRAAGKEAADAASRIRAEQKNLQDLIAARAATAREVERPSSPDIHQQEQSRNLLADLDRKIAESQQNLRRLAAAAKDAAANVRGALAPLAERNVAARLDPVQAATDNYTRALGRLRGELTAGTISQKTFEDRLAAAKKKLDAVKDSASKAGSAVSSLGYSGNRIGFDQARSIAQGAGFQVNSGQRTFAQQKALFDAWVAQGRPRDNPVAPPGTSAHEGAKGRWALDIQLEPGLTAGKVKKVFADQGVSVNVFPERGHLHVSGALPTADASAPARTQHDANDAKRAAEQAQRQQDDFEEARDRLNSQVLAAEDALVRGIEGQADVATRRVLDEEARTKSAIEHDLAEGKYGDATSKAAQERAAQLIELNHQGALIRTTTIAIQKREALEDAAVALADQQRSLALDGLRFQDEIATTQGEHRKAQLAILDALYEQKQLELEHEKQLAIRNGATADEIAAIQGKIDDLPAEKARDQFRTNQQTQGPLAQWAAQVPKSAAEINEALQSIEAKGLDGLTDAIGKVIEGTGSLKSAFHDLAQSILSDLIQMTIKMLIFRAISAIGGAIGGGASGGGGSGILSSSGGGSVSTGFLGLDGFATGGSFSILGNAGTDRNVMSLNGIPIAKVSHGERVSISNDNMPGAGGPSINMPIHIDATGADPAGLARVQRSLDQLRADLPGQIVATYQDARSRFVIRK